MNGTSNPPLLSAAIPPARRARWIHSLWTGVDNVLCPEVLASPLPLTNGRGVFRRPLAEWTIGAMLYFAYNMRRMIRQQQAGVWQAFTTEEIQGKTLGIVGYGGIGSTAAELARPFGMRIVALRRRPELFEHDALVDQSFAPAQLNEMMAASDYVLLAAPLTEETRGMIGAPQIAAMKPTGVLINVGRGAVVDEPALVEALESGKIRGRRAGCVRGGAASGRRIRSTGWKTSCFRRTPRITCRISFIWRSSASSKTCAVFRRTSRC